ncbi:CotJB protein [Clostridium acetireducens DSM 10703]|jgi:spore coat protein JB|uniref:CotJB protein n=1 Tax=Clostridium acetireducens DSM 10703 TaxID=1121290 RepID=A0A1E8EY76_9CLOT|nr:spore coat protein CotJB [Clostridium acetireducens]OFI05472.1 CotJB protein [Clostridium acetireducens DSM 10703]
MGKNCYNSNQRNALLRQIQELEFAAVELNLYLDNNPNNINALRDYNCITEDLMAAKKKYEMMFGPLTNFGYAKSKAPWQWVNEPWPWE